MLAVLTPDEMREVDARAPEPTEVLVARAGVAVARAALGLLGGAYGRRVVVVAGKGNNGADGRAAAERLVRRGVCVVTLDAADAPRRAPQCDLVIDAAYGTGFRGEYDAPDPDGAPVLAVDIPSGVDGYTGRACEGAVWADATVTFAAHKPGLLLGDGPERSGAVEVVDIGLDVSDARIHVVEDGDVHAALQVPPRGTHKWRTAVLVVAGSPGMMGAPVLVARGALRAGSGYARLAVPGAGPGALPAGNEAVAVPVAFEGWSEALGEELARCRAVVVGPGLGRGDRVRREVAALLAVADLPAVVDADGLNALGTDAASVLSSRTAPTVLTPHEGEFARVAGHAVGDDRIGAARALAVSTGAVVLLKGATTVVAAPDGAVRLAVSGDPRLATAGTGDVLSGVVGAFLARGLAAFDAAALAAHVHGAASRRGRRSGLVAGDLPELVADWLSDAPGGHDVSGGHGA